MSRQVKKYIFLLMAVLLLVSSTAMASRTIDKIKYPPLNDIELPNIEKIALDNGMTLYILEDHELPVVNASVRLAAGSYLDPADKVGLGDITGAVMRTGGTATMTGDEIDEVLESLGASVETSIGTASGSARMNVLSEYADTGLAILANVLRTPQFAQEKIDIEKSAQRTAISSRNDEALAICIREFKMILYGSDSPYARHTEYATIESITRDDLIAFHNKYITPENVMIAVWGDFDKDEMVGKIKKYFGDWAPGGQKVPPLPEVNYEYKKGIHYIQKDNLTQSTVLLGHIGGLTGDPDYFALTVANNVLGGSLGGRMFKEVRSKKGLAYSTGGNFTSNIAYPGFFFGYVITKLETTVSAAEAVWTEMRRMQTDPPTPEELKNAKDAYLNSFVFNFDSKGQIINRMMAYDYYGFPQDFLQTAKKKIEQITADDVLDVCQRRYHPDQMHLVVVGQADKFDKPLSTFGEVDTIDISIPTYEPPEKIEINEETLAKGMDLLNKTIKACGGASNFAKIKTGKTEATVTIYTPQMNLELEGESTYEFPARYKEHMTNAMIGEIISVIDKDHGWVKQMGQIKDLGSDEVKESMKEKFRNLTFLFSKINNPDYQAVYVKQDEIDGKPVEIIKVMSNDESTSFKLAVDSESFMPVAKMYFGNTLMGPANLVQYMHDFRDISGIKLPFSSETFTEDGTKMQSMATKSIELNPSLPEGTFSKPE